MGNRLSAALIGAIFSFGIVVVAWAAVSTKFSNVGSIVNSRHNLTQSSASAPGGSALCDDPTTMTSCMDGTRNNYGEICVYCHTPHGANTQVDAPLWNHTLGNSAGTLNSYQVYTSMSLTQAAGQPGANSLTCLSCHDGTVAVDSVINMPGSGGFKQAQENSVTSSFLSGFTGSGVSSTHSRLGAGCLACHTTGNEASGISPSFAVFNLGTDLTNDHPVGVEVRDPSLGYKVPDKSDGKLMWFEKTGGISNHADKNEIRFYYTDGKYKVECASCHDPHGVPDPTNGFQFYPTFLRVSNSGSGVCLTCHNK